MNHHASKFKGLLWIVSACAIALGLFFGLSPLAHAIPWSWEKQLGYAIELKLSKQEFDDSPKIQALLQRLIKRIYPIGGDDDAFSINVQVVKDSSVNAYATLGGNIYINSGLIREAESPEEVAGVLAHEISHVQKRHIMEGAITHLITAEGISAIFGTHSSAAEWANYFLRMDFSQTQEAEADEGGLKRLQLAHVDNQGFKQFFKRMEKSRSALTFISDHPSNLARLEMIDRYANQDTRPIMTEDEWRLFKGYYQER